MFIANPVMSIDVSIFLTIRITTNNGHTYTIYRDSRLDSQFAHVPNQTTFLALKLKKQEFIEEREKENT